MIDANDKLKEEIWKNFSEQQHVFLATADEDQPRVRPVTLIHLQDRFFVATGSNDAKTKQIRGNPKTEFCLLIEKDDQKGTIRVECIAEIIEAKEVKAVVYSKIPFLKEFWGSPKDPDYALIELQPISCEYMKLGSIHAIRMKL